MCAIRMASCSRSARPWNDRQCTAGGLTPGSRSRTVAPMPRVAAALLLFGLAACRGAAEEQPGIVKVHLAEDASSELLFFAPDGELLGRVATVKGTGRGPMLDGGSVLVVEP